MSLKDSSKDFTLLDQVPGELGHLCRSSSNCSSFRHAAKPGASLEKWSLLKRSATQRAFLAYYLVNSWISSVTPIQKELCSQLASFCRPLERAKDRCQHAEPIQPIVKRSGIKCSACWPTEWAYEHIWIDNVFFSFCWIIKMHMSCLVSTLETGCAVILLEPVLTSLVS